MWAMALTLPFSVLYPLILSHVCFFNNGRVTPHGLHKLLWFPFPQPVHKYAVICVIPENIGLHPRKLEGNDSRTYVYDEVNLWRFFDEVVLLQMLAKL